jgi:Kef-type K+ transport system membrane component KefB
MKPLSSSAGYVPARLFWGMLLLTLGVLVLLENMNLIQSGSILRWWPVLFIVMGISKLLGRRWGHSSIRTYSDFGSRPAMIRSSSRSLPAL